MFSRKYTAQLALPWIYLILISLTITANADSIKVACIGDSITAGARVEPATESYPARLQAILGKSFEVRNFGQGGATLLKTGTPNVWRQLKAIRSFQPDVAVISLGTNDTVSGKRKNWEKIDKFDDDLASLINELKQMSSSPQIILCTPTSMVLETKGLSDDRLKNLTERKPRLQNLCQRMRTFARQDQSISLLELNEVLKHRPDLVTEKDGVHPNKAGYVAIATTVSKRIRQLCQRRPNIVMFLVDDMGWQDTSVPFHSAVTPFNRRYRTPNMERLAGQGMKFTQAYACSVCSPTRVSLMTGLNAARHRVTNWTLKKNASNDRPHATLKFPLWNVNGVSPVQGIERTVHAHSLPHFLSRAGYETIHVGKAHFGAVGTPASDPCKIGFDVNIAGHAAGGPGSFLGTQNFSAKWRNGDAVWDVPHLAEYHGKEIFLTEALTIKANQAIDASVKKNKPFFLYMSHYAVHVPFAKDQRFIQKYLDQGLDSKEAMYAAMVEGMDKSLGDIMANVAKHDLEEETIFLFMSDNGGLSASGRGGKRHAHNQPLSSGKGSAREGGTRVPMIVHWPGVTTAASIYQQPVIIEDFFSTILSMAGVEQVEQVGGVIDGVDFSNVLHGVKDTKRQQRPFVWHFPNNWGPKGPGIGATSSIRQGNWKLIYYYENAAIELFDLSEDLGESNNLATKHPEIVQRLIDALSQYLTDVDAQFPSDKRTGESLRPHTS